MLVACFAGAIVFLIGLCAALLVERGGFRERTERAEVDALSLACEAEERLSENTRLLAELGARPQFKTEEMRRFSVHN